ncbi:family 20 glycosylhydrolase [Prevotella sp. KH2C16]|uniref:family 20 glycosylhydrolase n=1 Tax=Prevotella sp. KH2C16 TaxID=1855325 RepID=UPI0008E86AF2|nr:family 20 glycosylhydrolase [Prevotella sp. KH2C16]SFG16168.1 hexosaminidase [Prevotella sp. KH2C16]
MKTLKFIFSSVGLFLLLFLIQSCSIGGSQAPIELIWHAESQMTDSAIRHNAFVIKNVSSSDIDSNWCIYYSQLPKGIKRILTDQAVVEAVNANFFRIRPTQGFKGLHPGDSLVVRYEVTNPTLGISQVPEGAYWVASVNGSERQPLPINLKIVKPELRAESLNQYARQLYDNNALLTEVPDLRSTDIIPSVKMIEMLSEEGVLELDKGVILRNGAELENEATLLKEKLARLYGIQISDKSACVISLMLSADTAFTDNPEKYRMSVNKEGIKIESSTTHGIFNGTQTLLSLLKAQKTKKRLAYQVITDYPDLAYRGFMLDVARNFTSLENVKKIVDVLASYKINKLHLHLTDDEGWRLEIPGLEELTAVGGRRGYTPDESECLYPCYDGNFNPTASTSGNGYYPRPAFVDLLQYAAQRHVQVIPEIEAPGHARAAIVSMKARYNKYIKSDSAKATEYLLNEAADKSQYISAQSYTDNVINMSMPSTYRFMKKVISEIQKMYRDAGLSLDEIHLGGDEVPEGAWMGSPLCLALMQGNNLKAQHDLFEFFYVRMAETANNLGIKFSGWQEVGLHNTMSTDAKLLPNVSSVYCWNTVPEWGGDIVPYTVANKGYDVILCNVNNFYVDLMYTANFDEKGLCWAGTVSEAKSFSALPFSIYRSSRTDVKENPLNLDSVETGKVKLRPECEKNIKGVQAQLFSETIRSFDDVLAYIFPKMLGLVERGWNAHTVWERLHGEEEHQAYYKDLSLFYKKIALKELPYLELSNLTFRIPNPGLMLREGMLYANTPLKGVEVRYTTDGTEPVQSSALWEKPVVCDAKVIKARTFYLGRQSTVTTIKNI